MVGAVEVGLPKKLYCSAKGASRVSLGPVWLPPPDKCVLSYSRDAFCLPLFGTFPLQLFLLKLRDLYLVINGETAVACYPCKVTVSPPQFFLCSEMVIMFLSCHVWGATDPFKAWFKLPSIKGWLMRFQVWPLQVEYCRLVCTSGWQ